MQFRIRHKDLTSTGVAGKTQQALSGPVVVRGDHGKVACRDVRVRPWKAKR